MKHSQEKRKREEKPKYESPVVIPLGEVIKGVGGCVPGGPGSGSCGVGTGPGGACNSGSAPASSRRYKENIRLWV